MTRTPLSMAASHERRDESFHWNFGGDGNFEASSSGVLLETKMPPDTDVRDV